MKLTAYVPEHTDKSGSHSEWKKEWEPELLPHDRCFAITKDWRGRYYIQEDVIGEFWFTNIWGWRTLNHRCFLADEYGKTLFKYNQLQEAIDICERKNRLRKVKVKYL